MADRTMHCGSLRTEQHEPVFALVLLTLFAFLTATQAKDAAGVTGKRPADTIGTTRTLHFPTVCSLGALVDLGRPAADLGDPLHWWWWSGRQMARQEPIGEARGIVVISSETHIGLVVKPKDHDDDLAQLAQMPPAVVEVLGFDSSDASPSDNCLPALTSLKGLRTLLLEETSITNSALSSLAQIESLERLNVLDSDLDSTGIRGISKISSLRGLRLFSTHSLTTEDYLMISRLSALEELSLPGSPGREDLSHLARLPLLRHLRIEGGECCESGLKVLAQFPALEHLEFYDLSPRGLAALPQMPNLRTLDIQYKGDAYLPEDLVSLAGFPQLEHLKLTARFEDKGLAYLKSLKNLKSIGLHPNFQDFLKIGDATLAHLAELKSLEKVVIYTGNYTDEGLRHLSGLPKLKVLNMPNSGANFSDAGLVHLSKIRSLEELYLRGTNITDEGLRQLEGLSSLRSLKFLLPTSATEEGLRRLQSRLPGLKVIENGRK